MRLDRLDEYERARVRAHDYPDEGSAEHVLLQYVADNQPVTHREVDEHTEHDSRTLMSLWERDSEDGALELVQRPQPSRDGQRTYWVGTHGWDALDYLGDPR